MVKTTTITSILSTPSLLPTFPTDILISTSRIITQIRRALAATNQDAVVALPTDITISFHWVCVWAAHRNSVTIGAVGALREGTIGPAAHDLDAEFTWGTWN